MPDFKDKKELAPLPIRLVRVDADNKSIQLGYPPSSIFQLRQNESFFFGRGNPDDPARMENRKRNATYLQLPETEKVMSRQQLELEDKRDDGQHSLIIRNLGQTAVYYRLNRSEEYWLIPPKHERPLPQGSPLANLEIRVANYTLRAQSLAGTGSNLMLDTIKLIRTPS